MLTSERVSQLQDMVIQDNVIDNSGLTAEEKVLVTGIQDRINTYAQELLNKLTIKT